MDDARRFDALDGLRGLCACMVVLYHSGSSGWVANLPVVRNGYLFVDFFFVLSGFVIAHGYRARIAAGFPIWRFMGLRLGRVYPLHLAMLVPLVALEALALRWRLTDRVPFAFPNGLDDLARTLTFTQVFHDPSRVWNIPAWSIAAEIWTYLVFALLFRLLKAPGLLAAAALAIAAASLVPLALTQPRFMDAEGIGSLWRCFAGFGCGVAASLAAGRWRGGGTAAELGVLAASVLFVSEAGLAPMSLAAPLVFTLAVLVFSRQAGAVSALLDTAPIQALGRWSYSIYMVHWLVVRRGDTLIRVIDRSAGTRLADLQEPGVGSVIGGDLLTLAVLCVVVGVAALTYRWIERPGQRWSRAHLLPRAAARVVRAEREVQEEAAF